MSDSTEALLRRRLRRGLAVTATIACGVVAFGIAKRLHAQSQVKDWTEERAIPSVVVVRPEAGEKPDELVLPGTLRAYFNAPIYARVNGYVKHWYADIGAKVRAGEILADIETPELDQQIRQAEADLQTAQAHERLAALTADRWKTMLASEAVSAQESDEKAGDFAARQAVLAAAQANLHRLRDIAAFRHITAPFDGVVINRNTDVGALINAGAGSGTELFRVADEHAARVYVDVPESDADHVQVGLTARLTLPGRPDLQFTARVTNIAQAIRENSGTMQVELMAGNTANQLLPGSYTEVHFEVPARSGVLQLPTTALLFRKEGLQVATVDASNRVVLKAIRLARELGAVVDVSQGLSTSDRVIDSPPDSIATGDLVRVVSTGPAPIAVSRAPS